MRLQISLLGQPSIRDPGSGVIASRAARTTGLVAYLVLHEDRPVSRQRIAGVFWPDSGDAQALTNLRRELHTLRRLLSGLPCLVVTGKDVCWQTHEDVEVDLHRFALEHRAAFEAARGDDLEAALRHADTALAVYRGELLPGAQDEWLPEARASLQRQCVELCVLVTRARASRGEPAEALRAARRRIQLEPLEEDGYRALMGLLAGSGDRAAAVSTYHRCASVLERELGVLPDARTRACLRRIIDQQPQPRPQPQPCPQPGPRPRPACDAGTEQDPRTARGSAGLIGRSAELALLGKAWRTACAGRADLVLVRGDAGVGKTRLVTELARTAGREDAVVALSRCFGTTGRLALAPVADWLRHPRVQAAQPSLDPVWRAEVDRLVPAARGRRDAEAGPRAMVDAWQRHRFLEGLARALLNVDAPTLLVLDNLQWCDQESLAFIAFLLALAPGDRRVPPAHRRGHAGDCAAHPGTSRGR
jgi:DNA-binding SARP family transcriptional activator